MSKRDPSTFFWFRYWFRRARQGHLPEPKGYLQLCAKRAAGGHLNRQGDPLAWREAFRFGPRLRHCIKFGLERAPKLDPRRLP